MPRGQGYFPTRPRHIALAPTKAVIDIHRQILTGRIGGLETQVCPLRRLTDAIPPPREGKEICRSEEPPTGKRGNLRCHIPAVLVLWRATLAKGMGKHRPIIVGIVAVYQHHAVIGREVVTQPIEEGIAVLAQRRLACPAEASQAIAVIQADVIETVALQIVLGILPQIGPVRAVEEVVDTRHPRLKGFTPIGHVASRQLQSEGMPLLHLRRCAVQARFVDGSNGSLLHPPVHRAVRIEGGHLPSARRLHRSRHTPKVIILARGAMLADALRAIVGRSEGKRLAQPETIAQHQPLPEGEAVGAQGKGFQSSQVLQQYIIGVMVIPLFVVQGKERFACILLRRKACLHIIAPTKGVAH